MAGTLATIGRSIYWIYARTMTMLVYGLVFLIITGVITGVTGAILIPLIERVLPKESWAVALALALCTLPAVAFFYWRWRLHRWRTSNSELYEAQKAADEAARIEALKVAKSAPPSPFWQGVKSLITGLFYLLLAIGGIYVAYLIVSSLPISVAIVVGAVIIGLCILAARG